MFDASPEAMISAWLIFERHLALACRIEGYVQSYKKRMRNMKFLISKFREAPAACPGS